MKHIRLMMAAALAMAAALTGFGATATLGGVTYTYEVASGKATITGVTVGSVTEVTIPATLGGKPVTVIGWEAFDSFSHDTTGITSVVIPEGVVKIDGGAFLGCSSLQSVMIPSSVTTIGTSAFMGCEALTAVTIPSSVTTIGTYTFSMCRALVSVTIPSSVTTIGMHAFSECSALASVTIPSSVTWINGGAFSACSALTSVFFNGDGPTCGTGVFSGVASGAKAYVKKNATGFGEDGSTWNGLVVEHAQFDVVDDVAYFYSDADGEATIDRVLVGCKTEIVIPPTLNGIPVTALGQSAFDTDENDTANVTSVVIPEGVTTIGKWAFYKCTSLASVVIPEGVETIGQSAFYMCGLKSVTIPRGMVQISTTAFRDCISLKAVYFEGDVPLLGNEAFDEIAVGATAYVVPGAGGAGMSVLESSGLPIERYLPAGKYGKWKLPDFGIEPPAAGTVYSVKAYGLPSGLKLKYNAAKKDKKGKVIVKAKTDWWIEGVPTAALDAQTNPMYLAVTVGGKTQWHPIRLWGKAQTVTDMGTFTVGTSINKTHWLSGLVGGGWSVSGLPKGLKYTAKTVYKDPKKKSKGIKYDADTTYGKFSAAGLYTITAKKKVGGYYETKKFKVLVNPAGGFTTRNFTAYETFATMKDTSWKAVSGLPAGLKFTAKKYTVSGKITKAGTFAVTFTDKKGKKKTEMWIVAANPAGPALDFNTTGETTMRVLQGQTGEGNALTFPADGTVSVSGLPKGMKLVKNADGTYALGGVPATADIFFVTVKAVKNGRTLTQRVALMVEANPMTGAYCGTHRYEIGNLWRTASISIAASGKATLKYAEEMATYTLTASAGKPQRDGSGSVKKYFYTFVQKANTKKKIPPRTVIVEFSVGSSARFYYVYNDANGWRSDAERNAYVVWGSFYLVVPPAKIAALKASGALAFATQTTYAWSLNEDRGQAIYVTATYDAKKGTFALKGKLPLGKAFTATVPLCENTYSYDLAAFSAVDADGSRYRFNLHSSPEGLISVVYADGFENHVCSLPVSQLGPGYTALPTTFAAAVKNAQADYIQVIATYPLKGTSTENEWERFLLRATSTKYFQVSFDGGATWTKKADAKYDKKRGFASLSFTKGKSKYTVDLLYIRPERLDGQVKRQSNPVTNKKTKKTTYTTEYGCVVAWP